MARTEPASGPNPPPPPDLPSDSEDQLAAALLLRRLPAFPAVSSRLLGMMGQAVVNLKEISTLISSDATLTGEVLRLSNSALFAPRTEVRSILQALAVLGIEKVKGIVCTVALRSYLGNVLQIPALKRCWRHNLATAVVCSEIADWARQDSGEAYTAGILHDIGRIALIAIDPASYLQVIDTAVRDGSSLCAHEHAIYHLDHTVAGEWLASTWNLPPSICHAIRNHHAPLRAPYFEATGLIHYGCSIADSLGFSVLEAAPTSDQPIFDYLNALPAPQRQRIHIHIPEWQVVVASRINALEY